MKEMIKTSILDVIGSTPMVELKKIKEKYNLQGRIFCKLEYLNPSHSKKDRIAKKIVGLALESGDLKPNQPVVEATSGNTGIALSMVCAYLGHPFTAFMSQGNSSERIKIMESYGAKVVIVPQEQSGVYGSVTGCDFNYVKQAAKDFAETNGDFFINQFDNWDNVVGQFDFGDEIVATFSKADIPLDIFCDYVGTGGSFTGASTQLKKWNPECRCYVVEPENASVLSGRHQHSNPHIIQGGGYGYSDLPNLDTDLIDDYITVSDQEAKRGMQELALVEGIFGSFSSGTNMMATIKAMQMEDNLGKNAVFSVCDTGLKYLSVLK